MVCGNGPLLVGVDERGTFLQELQGDAARAWRKRWSSVLSCAAAKSFVLSLLDRVATGADGQIPSVHEVIRDDRFT